MTIQTEVVFRKMIKEFYNFPSIQGLRNDLEKINYWKKNRNI